MPSRRDVLRAGGVAAVTATPGGPPWLAATETTVATQNLGLGVRLYDLVDADGIDPVVVHERVEQLRENAPAERMRALAATLADHDPAVVGVQEAALVRRDGDLVADFLDDLVAGFEATDTTYRVAAVSRNADVSLPASDGDKETTVRFTDRDALLVRGDVPVDGTRTGSYGVNASTVLDGRRITATRGYCVADLDIDGVSLSAVSTHLSSTDARIRRVQAGELRELLPDSGALALLADLNSRPVDPSPSAYDILTERLADAWTLSNESGPTCCQFPQLGNERSRLRRRLDYVLVGGPTTPLAVERTLTEPSARIEVGDRRLWPSDHAGVVARLRVAPSLSDPASVLRAVLARLSGEGVAVREA